jgi:hypothetical protein
MSAAMILADLLQAKESANLSPMILNKNLARIGVPFQIVPLHH